MIYTDPSGHVWKWVGNTWKAVKSASVSTYNWTQKSAAEKADDVVNASKVAGSATYQFIIGDDIDVLMDPNSTQAQRDIAASIALNFTGVGELKILAKAGTRALTKAENETDEIYKIHVGDQVIESTYFVSDLGVWVHNTGVCAFGKFNLSDISSMTKKDILSKLPDEWKYTDSNGFVHVTDANGTMRMRDPPDKVTKYDHAHLYNEKGDSGAATKLIFFLCIDGSFNTVL